MEVEFLILYHREKSLDFTVISNPRSPNEKSVFSKHGHYIGIYILKLLIIYISFMHRRLWDMMTTRDAHKSISLDVQFDTSLSLFVREVF